MAGPPDPEPIGLHLTRVARIVSRAFDTVLADAGGSVPVWLILVSLKAQTHGAQSDIAAAVGIEGATLTHHLNRMEAAGLVIRRRDPTNRRVHQVELTDAGDRLFLVLLQSVIAFDQQVRAGFSERDLTQLGRLLDRLAANATPARHGRSTK
jgi:MarR family transcriptional regulator for hemolysin